MIWGGRWEGGSGLGTHVHPWLIHVNVWQNQHSIVKQNKVKIKIKKKIAAMKPEESLVLLKHNGKEGLLSLDLRSQCPCIQLWKDMTGQLEALSIRGSK